MVRGEAEWKRGIWNDCFHLDKSSTISLQCVWKNKMRVHLSILLLFFETCDGLGLSNMTALWNLPVYEAEEVKELLQRCLRCIKLFISLMLKVFFFA